jgi:sensor histidine kinase YesM
LPADLETTTVPPMLLQPLVENAIKHGLEPKVGPGSIEVVARATAAGIEIRINDSGLGLSQPLHQGLAAGTTNAWPGRGAMKRSGGSLASVRADNKLRLGAS